MTNRVFVTSNSIFSSTNCVFITSKRISTSTNYIFLVANYIFIATNSIAIVTNSIFSITKPIFTTTNYFLVRKKNNFSFHKPKLFFKIQNHTFKSITIKKPFGYKMLYGSLFCKKITAIFINH